MGRMETGKDTISDPAMGAAKPGLWSSTEAAHPVLPESTRRLRRVQGKRAAVDKDAAFSYSESSVLGLALNAGGPGRRADTLPG